MSATTELDKPVDLTFDNYNQWQNNAVSFENLRTQSHKLKATDKYVYNDGKWSIPDYEGFAVISSVNANPDNDYCLSQLINLRENLITLLQNKSNYYWLPEESYHQTIANTLSSERFIKNIKEPGLTDQYPGFIKSAFDKISVPSSPDPVTIKMLGFNVFGSCIALLGIFENEFDYNRIMMFRNQFYSNPELNSLGIKLTRPFIGHITYAYVGLELTDIEKAELADILNDINSEIINTNIIFKISLTELRYFKNLSKFYKTPDYPSFSFIAT